MKNGIKVLLFITCILFLKFFSTFFINQIIIKDYSQQKYDTNLVESLYIANISEPYISYYNHGNLLYQTKEYQKAIDKYKIALKKNPPKEKVCDIEINLSITIIATIDVNNTEDALSKLKEARNVLYENNCANKNDNNGNSEKAENLKEEIKKLEEQLKSNTNKNDPKEEEENKKPDEKEEKNIEEELKENRQKANQNRQDQLQYFENSINGSYYYGKTW